MEIASRRTVGTDVEDKPARYAALGIPEYWRFDETGNFHGTKLAGDRLVEGRYESIDIEEIEDGVLQGHSAALGLFIRWEHGQLRWPTQRRARTSQPSSGKGHEQMQPRPASGNWRRSWRGGGQRDRPGQNHRRQPKGETSSGRPT